MARMFGTDGVRGVANKDLSCELALKIGKAGAYVLTNEVHQPRILLGQGYAPFRRHALRGAYGGHLFRRRRCDSTWE